MLKNFFILISVFLISTTSIFASETQSCDGLLVMAGNGPNGTGTEWDANLRFRISQDQQRAEFEALRVSPNEDPLEGGVTLKFRDMNSDGQRQYVGIGYDRILKYKTIFHLFVSRDGKRAKLHYWPYRFEWDLKDEGNPYAWVYCQVR